MRRDIRELAYDTCARTTAMWAGILLLVACLAVLLSPASRVLGQEFAADPIPRKESVRPPKIKSLIDSTPTNQLRDPTRASHPPQPFDSTETTAVWTVGHSIVLIENSMSRGVPLTAVDGRGAPMTNARWKVIRNPADAAGLKVAPFPNADLTVKPTAGATTTLSLDAVGSFSVVAYIDRNTNQDYDAGEPAVFYNIVVCRVGFFGDFSQAYTTNQTTRFLTGVVYMKDGVQQPPVEAFQVQFGDGHGKPADVGASFETMIDVVGGGANGRTGVDRVFSGWCNNCSSFLRNGTYANNHSADSFLPDSDLPVSPQNYNTTPLPDNFFRAMRPTLNAARPLLDTSWNGAGTGGANICLPGSQDAARRIPLTLGESRTTTAQDSPRYTLIAPHPKGAANRLTRFASALDFTACLVIWTESAQGISAGSTLYMCSIAIPWSCRGTYDNFDWTVSPRTCRAVAALCSISFGPPTSHAQAVRLDSVGGEVMPPVVVSRAALLDASN